MAEVRTLPLDRVVVGVKLAEELRLRKTRCRHRVDDVFHLRGNNVVLGEPLILEQVAHQSLSQEMLNQHFVYLIDGQFGIQMTSGREPRIVRKRLGTFWFCARR